MPEIDKRKLTAKIVKSKELTALEKRYIERLIQTERPQASWVKGKFDEGGCHCSNCGIWKRYVTNLHYCGNCGAVMHGGFKEGAE